MALFNGSARDSADLDRYLSRSDEPADESVETAGPCAFPCELPLTAEQERRRRGIERRIRKATRELYDLAREVGCRDPRLWLEGDSASLVVFDESRGDSSAMGLGLRQRKVALSVNLFQPGVPLSCGAW